MAASKKYRSDQQIQVVDDDESDLSDFEETYEKSELIENSLQRSIKAKYL